MSTDAFTVRCSDCGRSIAIRSVSEFHNVGGFRGYSYGYRCDCGCCVEVDGCDGDDIPESLKRSAAQRRDAYLVLRTIDFQRRSMPQSDGKVALKSARLDTPEPLTPTEWLVYRFGDDWSVTFSTDSDTYSLRVRDSVHAYSDINDLTANLPGG